MDRIPKDSLLLYSQKKMHSVFLDENFFFPTEGKKREKERKGKEQEERIGTEKEREETEGKARREEGE